MLLVACSSNSGGGGGAGGGSNGAAFVGKWTYTDGTVTPHMCSFLGTTIPPQSLTGDPVTISQGADSSHIQFSAGSSCNIDLAVSGTTATAPGGQMCTLTFNGISAVVIVTSWVLTLSGGTMTSTFSGSAAIGGPSCTASGSGTLAPTPDASAGQ
jgi:hypothetical protein